MKNPAHWKTHRSRMIGAGGAVAGWLLAWGAAADPVITLPPTTSGGGNYGACPDAYISVAPPGTNVYLRIQFAGSGTMSVTGLTQGTNCRISYYAVSRSSDAPNDFKVSVDNFVRIGGPLFTVAGQQIWTNQVSGTNLAFNFTATGATASLKFEALNTLGGDRTVGFGSFSIATNPAQPVIVQALSASGIGATQATLRGMLDGTGGGDNPEVIFCWGLTNPGTTSTGNWSYALSLGTNWSAGQIFGTNISSLNPATTYWFQCFASNATGTDWLDNAQSFQTLAPATLSNAGSVVDSVWANVNGSVISSGGDTPFVWAHYWPSLAGAPTSTMALGTQTGAFQSALSGLSTNTAYAFAFQSSNGGGVAWSATNTFTTYSTPWFLNARFEDNGPFYNTTANTFKTPVTNWTLVGAGTKGIAYTTNTGDAYTSGSGFKSQILGLLMGGGISQTVSNFIPGQNYVLVWEGNARPGTGDGWLRITADGQLIWGDTCAIRSGAFVTYTSFPFKATSSAIALQWQNPVGVDNTTLLDNLRIQTTTNPVGPYVDTFPTASSGSPLYTSIDSGFGLPPYEGFTQLRMQFACSYTMTIRSLRGGWRTQVSLFARNRGTQQNPLQISVDGAVCVGSPTYTIPGNSAWTNLIFTFVSTGSTASLTFQTFSVTDQTVFFDGWTVTTLQPTMPGIMVQVN